MKDDMYLYGTLVYNETYTNDEGFTRSRVTSKHMSDMVDNLRPDGMELNDYTQNLLKEITS